MHAVCPFANAAFSLDSICKREGPAYGNVASQKWNYERNVIGFEMEFPLRERVETPKILVTCFRLTELPIS